MRHWKYVHTFVCRVGDRLTDSTPSVVVATLALPDPMAFCPRPLEERLMASSEEVGVMGRQVKKLVESTTVRCVLMKAG